MSGNAREITHPDVTSELEVWAERFHHMAINYGLLAIGGEEGDPAKFTGMSVAYGNASEFIWNRVREIQEKSR